MRQHEYGWWETLACISQIFTDVLNFGATSVDKVVDYIAKLSVRNCDRTAMLDLIGSHLCIAPIDHVNHSLELCCGFGFKKVFDGNIESEHCPRFCRHLALECPSDPQVRARR